MNNKEYKALCANTETYNGCDMLNREEVTELSRNVKQRKKNGSYSLEGFNNRATIREEGNTIILTSYYTDVCAIIDGHFVKLWDGYSATTMKHINTFCKHFGFKGFNKRGWIETPVNIA